MPGWAVLAHTFGENGHMLRVNLGCNPMSQVEYVAGTVTETGESFLYLGFNDARVRQHDGRVQVTLQGNLVPNPGPRIAKGNRPVYAQSIAAGVSQCFEMSIAALAKQHHRDAPAIV